MGCDIHVTAEIYIDGKYVAIVDNIFPNGYDNDLTCNPFEWRNYGMFAFFAGVRNYSGIEPIAPLRGWPIDVSKWGLAYYHDWDMDAHSPSWISVDELCAFDYDKTFYDERRDELTTYRDFLGSDYFETLKVLRDVGASRIVFFFDC